MRIIRIVIFTHINTDGSDLHFGVHFCTKTGKNFKLRYVLLYDIEYLLDSMISKGFRESFVFKNEMDANELVFSVEYYKEE